MDFYGGLSTAGFMGGARSRTRKTRRPSTRRTRVSRMIEDDYPYGYGGKTLIDKPKLKLKLKKLKPKTRVALKLKKSKPKIRVAVKSKSKSKPKNSWLSFLKARKNIYESGKFGTYAEFLHYMAPLYHKEVGY